MVPDGIRLNYEDLLVIGQGERNAGNENRSICLQAHKIFAGHSGIFKCWWVGGAETRESHDGKDKMYWIVIITITSGIRKTIG